MRLVSFNVNSVRSRLDSLAYFLTEHQPDVVGLQEIKSLEQTFPTQFLANLGYQVLVHGQKSYHGVAVLTKIPPIRFELGCVWSEDQARLIYVCLPQKNSDQPLHLYNVYFPNGETKHHPKKFPYKQNFYAQMFQRIQQQHKPSESLLIMGDFNIAPQDCDIGIGEANRLRWLKMGKCSFLPEEREMLSHFFDWGMLDPYRILHPKNNSTFSWFDYRSRGFEDNPKRGLRIDYMLTTSSLQQRCKSAEIDYELRAMEKPSDHCPVIYDFE